MLGTTIAIGTIGGIAAGYVGTKLGISTEGILGIGAIAGVVGLTISAPIGAAILGAVSIISLKELINNANNTNSNYYYNTKEEQEIEDIFNQTINNNNNVKYEGPINNTESSLSTRVLITPPPVTPNTPNNKEESIGAWKGYTSALWLLAIPIIGISLINSLSAFILPASLIGLTIGGYNYLSNNKLSTNIKTLLGVLGCAAGAYLALNVFTGGSFIYFLSLITIPSLLLPTLCNNNNTKVENVKDLPKEFLYGNSGSNSNNTQGPIIGALGLLATIIMGSGKDMLGTIINNDFSIMLDPYRLTIFSIISISAAIIGPLFINKLCNTNNSKSKNTTFNNPSNNVISLGISGLGMAVSLTTIGFLPTALCALSGLGIKWLLKDKSNNIAIGCLLGIGALIGI